ncbi:MAG: hypothetical protein WC890_05075 [Candidatus Margulisiibacteriota bacterium]
MLKVKSMGFGFGICLLSCILFLGSLISGCSQSSSPATTTTTTSTTTGTETTTTVSTTSTTTTTIIVTSVAIRGSIYSGSISAASIQASGLRCMATADAPLTNYEVIAVGTIDNKLYFPEQRTDTTGSFEIVDVPANQSYYFELINNTNQCVAPISFGPTGDAISIALTPEAGNIEIELGKIVYDSSLGGATPTIEPTAYIDENLTARKSPRGDIPVGAGNLGGGTEADYSGTLSSYPDEDLDGFPDCMDKDDNGNTIKDNFDPDPRERTVEISIEGGIHNFNAFCNTGCDYFVFPTYLSHEVFNSADYPMTTGSVLVFDAVMNGGVSPDQFSSIRVSEGPAWCDTAKIIRTDIPWFESGHALTKEADRWDRHLIPYGTPESGDVCKLVMVNATTSTSFESIITFSSMFYHIPRLLYYVDNTGTRETNYQVYVNNGNMFPYTGGSITIRWLPAKDDAGNYVITNIFHQLDGIIYSDSSGTTLLDAGRITITPSVESDPVLGTVYAYTFTPTTEAFDHFKFDIKTISTASSGSNAFQTVYFKKI